MPFDCCGIPATFREASNRLKPRHQDCLSRLSRIEGQVRGVARMVEEQRYCIDILTQLRAIKAALGKVETEILKDHADHCVTDAIQSGSEKKQKEKFNELIELFERYQK
jgi:DNA-binding FrmR family transcriptional regulator